MSIYKTAINKPISTVLIFMAVVIIGIYCYTQLPIDQFPEMEPPYISVMTTYPGANASEIETNVTKILDNRHGGGAEFKYKRIGTSAGQIVFGHIHKRPHIVDYFVHIGAPFQFQSDNRYIVLGFGGHFF